MASADRQMIGDATARICGKRRRQSARVLQEWNDLFGASRDRGLVGHHLVAADTQGYIGRHRDLRRNPRRQRAGRDFRHPARGAEFAQTLTYTLG